MSVILFFILGEGFLCSSPGFLCCRFSLWFAFGFGLVCSFVFGSRILSGVFMRSLGVGFAQAISIEKRQVDHEEGTTPTPCFHPTLDRAHETNPLSAAYTDIHHIPSSSSIDRPGFPTTTSLGTHTSGPHLCKNVSKGATDSQPPHPRDSSSEEGKQQVRKPQSRGRQRMVRRGADFSVAEIPSE